MSVLMLISFESHRPSVGLSSGVQCVCLQVLCNPLCLRRLHFVELCFAFEADGVVFRIANAFAYPTVAAVANVGDCDVLVAKGFCAYNVDDVSCVGDVKEEAGWEGGVVVGHGVSPLTFPYLLIITRNERNDYIIFSILQTILRRDQVNTHVSLEASGDCKQI